MPLPRNLFRLLTNFNPFSFYLSKFLSFHFSLTTWNSNFTQNNNNNNNYERNKSFPNQVLSTLGRAGSTLSPTRMNLVNPTSEKDASHPCLVSTLLVLVHEISFDLHYSLLMIFSVFSNGFANRNAVVPNFNHVNQPSLDKILKAEVFVHTDGQLRAAHLRLHPYLQKFPGAKVRHQSQGSSSAPNQCCYSRLSHHRSRSKRHAYHHSHTRGHTKGSLATTAHNRRGHFFSPCHHKRRRKRRRNG